MSKNKVSFYKTNVKKTIYRTFIFIIVAGLAFSLLFIIPGAVNLKHASEFRFFLYVSPLLFAFSLIYTVIYPGPIVYKKIEKLLNEKDEDELIHLAKKINVVGSVALCALFDLNPSIVKTILDEYNVKGINPKRDLGLIKKLNIEIFEMESKEKIPLNISNQKSIVPITKTYFIRDSKELGKCMISKMPLTLDSEVVICPYCGNMAKKDLLGEWLKEKSTCPVCFTQMTIDDCPIVDVRDH